ncbi:MAG: hypothetical protein K1X29_10745, partial [Bdellovibrionales bacterium]|nr:hypothetical protein [Bdellovibrionales bacterium]
MGGNTVSSSCQHDNLVKSVKSVDPERKSFLFKFKTKSINLIYILVLVSGFTGLVYQVIWQKYLAMFLGSHASSTSLVLTCFFLYLSLGYYLVRRLTGLNKNRLSLYAWLELGIGIYALISPDFFSWLKSIYWQKFPIQQPYVSGFVMTSLCIGWPTLLMGGTIPVLTEGLSSGFKESHKVHARVYAANTLGAFLGAVLCSFVFIERFGLPLTLIGAGVANFFVFFVAYFYSRWSGRDFSGPQKMVGPEQKKINKISLSLYAISFLSGFYVFSLENILIRMTGISLGSSVYSYGLIVAGFILAIALGSSLSEKFDPAQRPHILSGLLLLTWIGAALLYRSVPEWPDFFLRLRLLISPTLINFEFYLGIVLFFILLILLIPIGLMGMNLPLLFGYLRSDKEELSAIIGRLYAVNCLGSVFGASLGGYLLFMWWRTEQIFRFNLFLIALSGFFTVMFILKKSVGQKIFAGFFFILVVGSFYLSNWPLERLAPTRVVIQHPFNLNISSGFDYIHEMAYPKFKTLFFEDDPNTSVSVLQFTQPKSQGEEKKDENEPSEGPQTKKEPMAETALLVNGKADASYPVDAITRTLLPVFATTIAPEVKKIFIVGLGPGLSTAITTNLKEVEHVDVAEISQGVINALPQFEKFNQNLNSRKDKYTLHLGDAYQILQATKKKYDLILSEPSNPWIAGVDKLFTADFFSAVAQKLNEQGVFGQWFPIGAVNTENFILIMNTMKSVFPFVTVWNSGGGAIALIASKQIIRLDVQKFSEKLSQQQKFLDTYGISSPLTLLGLQLIPPWVSAGLGVKDKRIHTLEFPTLTYSAARSIFGGDNAQFDLILAESLLRPVPVGETTQLLIDQWPKPWPEKSLQEIIGFYKNLGVITSSLFSWRWLFEKKMQYPQDEKKTPKSILWMRAVVGRGPIPESSHPEDPTNKVRNLLLAYQRAKWTYLQPKPSVLLSQLDWSCKTQICADTEIQVWREL